MSNTIQELLITRMQIIIALFCEKEPTKKMILEFYNNDNPSLQDFVGINLKEEFYYATGISVIEAAKAISISQIENGVWAVWVIKQNL